MRNLLLTIYIFISLIHFGQSNTTFNALNFNTTARISALGGTNVGVFDHDPSTSLLLPSNLERTRGSLLMNYVNYFADTDIAILSYILKSMKLAFFLPVLLTVIMVDLTTLIHREIFQDNNLVPMIFYFKLVMLKD